MSYIKYRWKLRKLLRLQEKTQNSYKKNIKKAHKENKSHDDIEEIRSMAYSEYLMLKEEIDEYVTNYLTSVASKLMIPKPDLKDDSMWYNDQYTSRRKLLTENGISLIRSNIRNEKKESINLFLPIIAAITGMIGAITGLLAIILK